MIKRLTYIIAIFLATTNYLLAQESSDTSEVPQLIMIDNSDSQVIDLSNDPPKQYFYGNVRAFHKGTYFFCDTAIVIGKDLFAKNNVIIQKGDSLQVFASTLDYSGDNQYAKLRGKVIFANKSDSLFTPALDYDIANDRADYYNKAILKNGDVLVKSQKGTYFSELEVAKFFTKVSVTNKDFYLVNDSLTYDTKNNLASWQGETDILQDSAFIYSNGGYYLFDSSAGVIYNNANYQTREKNAKADTIKFNNQDETFELINNAEYYTKKDTATANVIRNNGKTGETVLIGDATFIQDKTSGSGERIIYNDNSGSFSIDGESRFVDGSSIITGESLFFNQKTNDGIAIGNVIWRDTVENYIVESDSLNYSKTNSTFSASNKVGRPLLIMIEGQDSTFIKADTFRSEQAFVQIDSTTVDTVDYMIGDNDVRIFSDDMQSICDSLSYNRADSLFKLMNRAFIWVDSTQLQADTMKLTMSSGKPDQLDMTNRANLLMTKDELFFDQVKGDRIIIEFKNDEIDKMKVNNNSKSVFYMKDEVKAYVGVNVTTSTLMIFGFEDGEILDVRCYTDIVSQVLPMKNTDHNSLRIPGFIWNIISKPKSKLDL